MATWRERRSIKRKERRRNRERYSFGEFLLDLFFYIPELIILPFRLVGWLLRGIGRLFDAV